MPLLGSFEQENLYLRMQDAEHRATCQRRDEDATGEDPEIEELLRFFDAPEPRLPSPPEEESATEQLRRRMARLATAGVEHDPRDWR